MSDISDAISMYGSLTNLARAIGVSVQSVCFWRDGERVIAPDKCVAIERATGGVVTRRDLRPDDWWKIWPELVDDDSERQARPFVGADQGQEEILSDG